jgi:hypothetical protein
MKILKVKEGLLEYDNYFIVSPFPDFLGVDGSYRDANNFYITTDTNIERRINYENYLIEIQKLNWETGDDSDAFLFYIGNQYDQYGIIDVFEEEQSEFHKIIYLDKFIQCYVSEDRKNWKSLQGLNIGEEEPMNMQGFKKTGANELKLMDYKVYSSPFLVIQNFPENYRVELYDSENTLLKERLFSDKQEAEIYLDYCMTGYVKIYDTDNNLVYESDEHNFDYGDVYILCDYDLELIYKERTLPEGEVTPMDTYAYSQKVTLRNVSAEETYIDLNISTVIDTGDIIRLSLDNTDFTEVVTVPSLAPNEEVDIYVQINRGMSNEGFLVREFLFKVD